MLSHLFFIDMTVFCSAICEGDYDYCKVWVLSFTLFKNLVPFISLHIIRILETKPELACEMEHSVLKVVQVVVRNCKPDNVNIPLAHSNGCFPWGLFNSDDLDDEVPPQQKLTPLHYACLLGEYKDCGGVTEEWSRLDNI